MLALVLMSSMLATSCELSAPAIAPVRIELYTSEGCSSCPPAERWMNSLPTRDDMLPMAFHVDYWNYLGWRDRFADARYSARQQRMAERFARPVVYTPAVAIDGAEWRWRSASPPLANRPSVAMTANIKVSAHRLRVRAYADRGTLHVAVTESNLHTEVRAGENAGATLRHDHVVRAFGEERQRGPVDLKLPNDVQPANARVLLWLEDDNGSTLAGISAPLADLVNGDCARQSGRL